MPVKSFAFEFKSLTQKGQFTGLASTYTNVDLAGDVVMPGAFTRTLASNKTLPLMWQHREPLGLVDLTDSPEGLVAEGRISMGIQLGKDAYELMNDGVVRGLSIGFQTVKEQSVGAIRQLTEVKLFEISLVTIPCNESAVVTSVKAAHNGKIQIALKDFHREILAALKR